MKLLVPIANQKYLVDTEVAYSLAIPMKFNGPQPNHFGAEPATRKAMQSGNFIGDTKRGGSCNVDTITLNPHCNGTHTESIHHIVDESINIGRLINHSLSACRLLTLTPKPASKTQDSYKPSLQDNDLVIDLNMLKEALDLDQFLHMQALVIRTLPNQRDKCSQTYNDDKQPPFFTREAMQWLSKSRIKHLLVDFPSVDKMYDEGRLTNHRLFWQVKSGEQKFNEESKTERTITEMIYVKNHIDDGLYLLNLQIPSFELDAAPSRPIIYPLQALKQGTNQ